MLRGTLKLNLIFSTFLVLTHLRNMIPATIGNLINSREKHSFRSPSSSQFLNRRLLSPLSPTNKGDMSTAYVGNTVTKRELKNRVHGDERRALNIQVHVMTSEPVVDDFENELMDLLNENYTAGEISQDGTKESPVDIMSCKECVQKKKEDELPLKPAYPCDSWDSKTQTCWLDRNIGDTVTFVLTLGEKREGFSDAIWKQEFHLLHKKERKEFIIQSDNPLWNIVIGSGGHEFRVSPITEMDVDPNLFSATLSKQKMTSSSSPKNVHFKIRSIPIDLGFVYPGETIVLNMDSFIALPLESLEYVWYLETDSESGTLPSNMKISPSGNVLVISELRKEQEGVVSCAVYSNLGVLIAKKRFLIKEINQNKLLMHPPIEETISPPAHNHHAIKKRKYRKIKSEEEIEKALIDLEYTNSGVELSTEGWEADDYESKDENQPLPYKANSNENTKVQPFRSTGGFKEDEFKYIPKQLSPPASVMIMNSKEQQKESDEMTSYQNSQTQDDSRKPPSRINKGNMKNRQEYSGMTPYRNSQENFRQQLPSSINREDGESYVRSNSQQKSPASGINMNNMGKQQKSGISPYRNFQGNPRQQFPPLSNEDNDESDDASYSQQKPIASVNMNKEKEQTSSGMEPSRNSQEKLRQQLPPLGDGDGSDEASNVQQKLPSLRISDVRVTEGQYLIDQKVPHSNDDPFSKSSLEADDAKYSDVSMEVERESQQNEAIVEDDDIRPDDQLSKLIAECQRDKQCSGRATCIQQGKQHSGFCRCLPNYHGNGVSCWEDVSLRRARVVRYNRGISKVKSF